MSGIHKKLTFSDYLSFFRTRNGDELTYDQLVQVLFIHGFIKSRAHKVMTPSLTQIWRDLYEIGWEECPIGSVETVQPAQLVAETFMAFPSNSASQPSQTQVATEEKVYVRKRRGKNIRKS